MTDTSLGPIRDRTIGEYLEALASSRPAPGGGSVAGLTGALAAALGMMVISLSARNEIHRSELHALSKTLSEERDILLGKSESDEKEYAGYIAATKWPKSSEHEKSSRRERMQEALTGAALAPLGIAEHAVGVLELLEPVARLGTRHALSDVEIAISLAHAAANAGLVNVRINIPLIKNEQTSAALHAQAEALERRASELLDRCLHALVDRKQGR